MHNLSISAFKTLYSVVCISVHYSTSCCSSLLLGFYECVRAFVCVCVWVGGVCMCGTVVCCMSLLSFKKNSHASKFM